MYSKAEKHFLQLYIKPFFLSVFLLGFASGSAFILVSSSIPFWLSEEGYSPKILSWIFLATAPYCLKFLWAPIIDLYSIPFFCRYFGQRRGWALVIQLFLILSIFSLTFLVPEKNIVLIGICVFCISFFAACQDVVLDALRIENLSSHDLALGTAFSSSGFRFGMLSCGAITLYISKLYSWEVIYQLMLIPILLGTLTVLTLRDQTHFPRLRTSEHFPTFPEHIQTIYQSLKRFFQRENCFYILLFIVFFKASDSIPNAMSNPLFLDLQYSATEIATVAKSFGVFVMILGGLIGGIIITYFGMKRGLLICGIIQLLAPILFVILVRIGYNVFYFTIILAIQNLCCGIGATAFITFISSLCSKEYTATEFATLYSFSSMARILLSSCAGWLTAILNWEILFICVAIFSMMFIPTIRKIKL